MSGFKNMQTEVRGTHPVSGSDVYAPDEETVPQPEPQPPQQQQFKDKTFSIVNITHFKDNKPTSSIYVWAIEPHREGAYVRSGGFFFTVKNGDGGKITTKLSDFEALNLAERIKESYSILMSKEIALQQ